MTAGRPELLTVAQAAEQLGCRPATVRRMIARGELPVMRINQRFQRVRAADLEGLILARLRRAGTAGAGPWGAGAAYPPGSRWWDR